MNESFIRALKPGAFTNCQINKGRVVVGTLDCALAAKIDAPDCVPDYEQFARACRVLKSPQFVRTTGGNLRAVEGKHAIVIPAAKDAPTFVDPGGSPTHTIDGARLLEKLTALRPFVTPDTAKPPFFSGVHFVGSMLTAYGANGCVQAWVGPLLPKNLSLHFSCVDTLLALAVPPSKINLTDHAILFDYGDVLFASQLLACELPDFNLCFSQFAKEELRALDPQVFLDVKALKRSVEESALYVRSAIVATHRDYSEKGAHVVTGVAAPFAGFMVNADAFSQVLGAAKMIDYGGGDPWRHVFWTGQNTRGMLLTGRLEQ